jgi:glutamine synthetase
MNTVQGYKATSWAAGYGDYVHKPDLSTLRRVPWLPGTAMVMCDVLDHHTHEEVPHAPRTVLKRQIARARAMGFEPMMATELEFYLFEKSFEALWDEGYRDLRTVGRWNQDYAIMGSSKEEDVMRAIRNGLYGAGIPVENTKGEADAGQEEINIRYSDALDTADMHSIVKNACKEIAHRHGRSLTFMAKYAPTRRAPRPISTSRSGRTASPPSSTRRGARHVGDDAPLHGGASRPCLGRDGVPRALRQFLQALLRRPLRADEGRLVGRQPHRGLPRLRRGTKGVRVECRVGGSDLNPYLALAAQLAAGLDGIERKLELEPELTGDMYQAEGIREIPKSLRDAAAALHGSAMLRAAMGDDVVDHYHRAALWEISEADRVVTDWDVKRGFERA